MIKKGRMPCAKIISQQGGVSKKEFFLNNRQSGPRQTGTGVAEKVDPGHYITNKQGFKRNKGIGEAKGRARLLHKKGRRTSTIFVSRDAVRSEKLTPYENKISNISLRGPANNGGHFCSREKVDSRNLGGLHPPANSVKHQKG